MDLNHCWWPNHRITYRQCDENSSDMIIMIASFIGATFVWLQLLTDNCIIVTKNLLMEGHNLVCSFDISWNLKPIQRIHSGFHSLSSKTMNLFNQFSLSIKWGYETTSRLVRLFYHNHNKRRLQELINGAGVIIETRFESASGLCLGPVSHLHCLASVVQSKRWLSSMIWEP